MNTAPADLAVPVPGVGATRLPVLVVLRGVGQVFFQESALSGALFVVAIALSSPLMAAGALFGAAIGSGLAHVLRFDRGELTAGIYGFNSTLVGVATFFYFQLGVASILLLIGGCVVATLITRFVRQSLPFPTYTAPFIVTTWVLFFLGRGLSLPPTDSSYGPLVANFPIPFLVEATAHGIGQVMFQGSFWTGALFFVGIAVSDWRHALWVLAGAIVGMLVASYHLTLGARALDPERLIDRSQFENIALGLYGYNATLAPLALYLSRKSLLAPLMGMLISVPLTELVPLFGLPALTAPFVLATWLVLVLLWIDRKLLGQTSPMTT